MGRLVHFEIQAEDPERAVGFYEAVLGWTTEKWEGPVDSWLVSTGSKDESGIDGAIMPRRGPAPAADQPVSAFVCTAQVDDLDSAVDASTSNGGELAVERTAVPGVGHLAYVKDTEGNILGLMQPDKSPD